MLNDLKELLAVPSVMGKAENGAPFGAGPKAALCKFLEIAARYGLRTHNENGYCGWAEWGEGDELLGILGHLDVVPAGNGWSHEPFALTCENGMLYGRGVADDKGPTVAALHALVRLKEKGVPLRHRVRLIVGCNEENGSECIEYYRGHCEIPVASFVPDADFPLINSEKGILHADILLLADPVLRENITELCAGDRPNVVPAEARAVVPKHSPLFRKLSALGHDNEIFSAPEIATAIVTAHMRIEDFSVHFFEDKLTIEARGVAGHAMAPEKAENAAVKLLVLLAALLPQSTVLMQCAQKLNAPNPAALLGMAASDEISGDLTVNLGVVKYDRRALILTLDCRLPLCADMKEVVRTLQADFPACVLHVDRFSPNLYVPQDGKLAQALLSAYEEVTGEKGKCLYCGGGTYARELPNAVAFGPTFPDLETDIHNADEHFPVELFHKLPDIYEAAIRKLDEVF